MEVGDLVKVKLDEGYRFGILESIAPEEWCSNVLIDGISQRVRGYYIRQASVEELLDAYNALYKKLDDVQRASAALLEQFNRTQEVISPHF